MPKFIKLQTIDHGEMLVNINYIAGVYQVRFRAGDNYTIICHENGNNLAVKDKYEEVVKQITE